MDGLMVTTLLAWMLIAVGIAVWRLPVSHCDQCPHCRLEQLRRLEAQQLRARERDAAAERSSGLGRCDLCGRVDLHDHRDRDR